MIAEYPPREANQRVEYPQSVTPNRTDKGKEGHSVLLPDNTIKYPSMLPL
jgi:hypothetical protein